MAIVKPILLLATGLALLLTARSFAFDTSPPHRSLWRSQPSPLLADLAFAGPLRGLASDYALLETFSIYYETRHVPNASRPQLWKAFVNHLTRAQRLDPAFFDVYRVAGALLTYDARMPDEAVRMLRKGTDNIPDNWEIPFLAGFIAYDQLKNSTLAFELMSEAAKRPDAPAMTASLASRFLEGAQGPEASIRFLEEMMLLFPEKYHEGLKNRIREIRNSSKTLKRDQQTEPSP